MKKILLLSLCGVFFAACGATTPAITKSDRYPEMYRELPVTILVMPPINRSIKVEAKELFYGSLVVPLTQRGYYVLPPLLTMEILKEESAYDSELFVENSMKKAGELFGADAVLFTTIHEWAKTSVGGQVSVTVEYTLKSAKTDNILFNRTGNIVYIPDADSGDALADMLTNMVLTAMTREIKLARQCNGYALGDLPAGTHSPAWQQDNESGASVSSFSISL